MVVRRGQDAAAVEFKVIVDPETGRVLRLDHLVHDSLSCSWVRDSDVDEQCVTDAHTAVLATRCITQGCRIESAVDHGVSRERLRDWADNPACIWHSFCASFYPPSCFHPIPTKLDRFT